MTLLSSSRFQGKDDSPSASKRSGPEGGIGGMHIFERGSTSAGGAEDDVMGTIVSSMRKLLSSLSVCSGESLGSGFSRKLFAGIRAQLVVPVHMSGSDFTCLIGLITFQSTLVCITRKECNILTGENVC